MRMTPHRTRRSSTTSLHFARPVLSQSLDCTMRRKSIREKGMSLNEVLRGTGDIAASADAVYGLLRDTCCTTTEQGRMKS